MKFSEFAELEDPAYEVFLNCLDIVFDEDDENTEHLERLSKEARLVYLVWSVDGEIHNGGFDQLFINSLGDYTLEIIENLKVVGASKSVLLFEAAIKWFPDSKPAQDREERWTQLDAYEDNEDFENALNKLDEEFYKYEDNLTELVNQFVKQNPKASIEA